MTDHWPEAEHEPHSDEKCKGEEDCECCCTECMSVWSSCICEGCECDL